MSATFHPYRPERDLLRVAEFLQRTYPADDRNANWLRARWEYMVFQVSGDLPAALPAIGVWEDGGEIVAVVTGEGDPGEAYLQVDPAYGPLRPAMLAHAEAALSAAADGRRRLTVYVNEFDGELAAAVAAAGYVRADDGPNVTARLDLSGEAPAMPLPAGYTLTDRAHDNDLALINRVLWRGFNHPGPPPEKYVAGRADVEGAPLYRPELVVMAKAPEGHYVSYCGVWYEPATRVAYVEPVATDPDYRRQGFGRAAVLGAAWRAAGLGATRAIVISGQAFYHALGFRPLFAYYLWRKEW